MTARLSRRQALIGSALALSGFAGRPAEAQIAEAQVQRIVDEAIRPVMSTHDIPGMAVAVTARGQRYFFYEGVASRESGQRVAATTLFEIGSISKTFTATLAASGAARGALAFSDPAGRYLPALAGSSLESISLLDLGTYTAGGLPLQFPAEVTDHETMIAFFRSWRPTYAAGTHRRYSNPSIGLFGDLAARAMGRPFDDLMERELFPALGLSRTFIRVPRAELASYAYGYGSANRPIRVSPGVLGSQAYGVKTTAADLIRFVEINMDASTQDETLRRAIAATQAGYYRVGDMMQGVGWESYAHPTSLDRLLAGNSSDVIFNAKPATRLAAPASSGEPVLINKTGSTNGFGAYVAFVPARRIGIAMLANRNYPIPARVTAAHRILSALDRS